MRNGGKTLDEVRAIAMGAARSKAKEMGMDLSLRTANDMLAILDDIARAEDKRNWAAKWYIEASEAQIKLFKRDWLRWLKEQKGANS